jgi:hypothetical protein
MTLGADYNHEKAIIIVEGPDDIEFLNGKLSENVDIYESFSGKEGVKEIVSHFSEKRVLGICDKDYSPPTPEGNIIYYDNSCLEMMMIGNENVFKSFVDNFYFGNETAENLLMKIFTNLKWLSVFRKLNSENSWEVRFKGLSIAASCVSPNLAISVDMLLQKLTEINKDLISNHREFLVSVSIEARQDFDIDTYLNITQGHDFIEYFQKIAQESSPLRRSVSKDTLFCGLCCAFRYNDFKATHFYHTLMDYAEANNLKLVS